MSEPRTLLPAPREPGAAHPKWIDVNPRLPAAVNRFGCELFVRLCSRGEENTLLSPLSVWLALVMAWFGAEGETAEELGQVLHLDAFDKDQLQEDAKTYLSFVRLDDPDGEVSIANSLWMRNTVELKEPYVRRITGSLRSALFTRDFGDPRVLDEVNRWVRDHTRGRIEGIVSSLHPETSLLILNAIAFKGTWWQEFDPERTRVEDFQTRGGVVRAPLMERTGAFSYREDERLQAVRLPYMSANGLAMYVFLPRPGVDLEPFCSELDADRWRQLARAFGERRGTLWLPRFGAQVDYRLTDLLMELGLQQAMDPGRADFEAMASTTAPLFIDDVRHRVTVDVDEQGTEAEAATLLHMVKAAVKPPRPPSPFEMRVDRPFFFVIADGRFSTILFMGTVGNPAATWF